MENNILIDGGILETLVSKIICYQFIRYLEDLNEIFCFS